MMLSVASKMLLRNKTAVIGATHKNFATLVLAEHFEGQLSPTLGSVLKAAGELNDNQVDVLVHGDGCDA